MALPDSALAARQARRAVIDLLALCGLSDADVSHTAALLTSELVTNAIQHSAPGERGERRFWLDARVEAGALRVAVHDPDPTTPAPGDPPPDAEQGRGLRIIASQSKEWGTTLTPGQPGKAVWFVVPLDASRR